jgi:dTDP-glucose 4,6-dehydratase
MSKFDLISKLDFASISERTDFKYFCGKRILITGGGGMIGSWIATSIVLGTSLLLKQPASVHVISRRSNPENLLQINDFIDFKYIQGSVVNSNLKDYDLIIHAASAASPVKFEAIETMHAVNSGVINNLVKNSPKLDQLVFISTGEVYGMHAPLMVKESFQGSIDPALHRSSYPISKLAAEIEVRNAAAAYSFNPGIIRLFHSFGPGVDSQDGRAFADFIWRAAKNKNISLLTNGTQIRSLLYLEDAIVGILKVITQRFADPINVGSHIPITVRELAHKISIIAGVEYKTNDYKPENNYELSPNNIMVPSNELLKSLGWEQLINLDETIARTLDWCKNKLNS